MTANKTARIQHDTPTKNWFIGAMEATGKLHESAATYGIKPSTASNLRTKYKKHPTLWGSTQAFRLREMAGGAKLSQRSPQTILAGCTRYWDEYQ